MNDDTLEPQESDAARRRRRFGLYVSGAWVLACLGIALVKWEANINFHDLMEAIAAAAGPLALLWLILGYQQQGEELNLQRQELALQRQQTSRLADETKKQADAVAAAEVVSRRDLILRLYEILLPIQISAARQIATAIPAQIRAVVDHQFVSGDKDAYFFAVTRMLVNDPNYFGPGGRATRTDQFNAVQIIENFENICKSADSIEIGGEMRRVFENTPWATCYAALCFRSNRTPDFKWRRAPGRIEELEYR